VTILGHKRVAVISHIVLGVTFTSMTDLDVRSVGVRRSEVRNVVDVAGRAWSVLNKHR